MHRKTFWYYKNILIATSWWSVFFTNVLILNAIRYPWNQTMEYCEILCIIIRVRKTQYSTLTSFINNMIRHKISRQSKMIISLLHLSVRENDEYYESILILSNVYYVTNYLLNSMTKGFVFHILVHCYYPLYFGDYDGTWDVGLTSSTLWR